MKYIGIVFLCVVFYSNTMEIVKQDPSVPCDDICYLNKIPRDILSYIASFLMETEEEFIARTKTTNVMLVENGGFYCRTFGLSSMKYALCPDEKNWLVLGRSSCIKYEEIWGRTFVNRFYEDKMMIIDLPKKKDAVHKVIYEKKIDKFNKYKCCALSRGGSIIGMLYSYSYQVRSYDMFDIEKTTTQEKKTCCLPAALDAERFFFNKQGTHIIFHGKKYLTKEELHHIVPLKNVDPNQMDIISEATNQLQNYFRDKFVCNKFIKGEK